MNDNEQDDQNPHDKGNCLSDHGLNTSQSTTIIEVLSLTFISTLLGKPTIYAVISTLLFYCLRDKLEMYQTVLEHRRLARHERAQRQRLRDVQIITAILSENSSQPPETVHARLEALRQKAQQSGQQDILEMVSCIGAYLNHQANPQAKDNNKQLAIEPMEQLGSPGPSQREREREQRQGDQKDSQAKPNGGPQQLLSLPPLPHPLSTYNNPLDPTFTCIGITKKGNRCSGTGTLPTSSRTLASQRLEKMATQDPGTTLDLESLQELAGWMLCRSQHYRGDGYQKQLLVRKWSEALKPAREVLAARRACESSRSKKEREDASSSSSSSSSASFSASTTSSSSRSPASSAPSSPKKGKKPSPSNSISSSTDTQTH